MIFDLIPLSAPTSGDHLLGIGVILFWGFSVLKISQVIRRGWSTATRFGRIFLAVFLALPVSFCAGAVIGEILLILHNEQQTYAHWLESGDYQVEKGTIESLVLKEKSWRSDPVPSFRIGEMTFTYGLFGENNLLQNHEQGGPLQEGLAVEIWHHQGKILRIFRETESQTP